MNLTSHREEYLQKINNNDNSNKKKYITALKIQSDFADKILNMMKFNA